MLYRTLLCMCMALVLISSCSRNDDKPTDRDTTARVPAEPAPAGGKAGAPAQQIPHSTPDADPTNTTSQNQPRETGRIAQVGPAAEEKGNTAPKQFIGMSGTLSMEPPPQMGTATLRAVRTAQHPHFDRITFEFDSEQIPGYHIEYIDKPVRDCGAGNVVPIEGDGWIEVRMTPARAHTDDGQPTAARREYKFAYPVFREVKRTCDFEGTVTYVIGVSSPNKFRLLELTDPARLVVDVDH